MATIPHNPKHHDSEKNEMTSRTEEAGNPAPLPNNQYIAQGVDILRFDPYDPGGPEGYGSTDIFRLDVSVVEPDGKFKVPAGSKYQADSSLRFKSYSYLIKSAAGFSASFARSPTAKIKAEGGPFGLDASLFSASFSASRSYHQHQQGSRLTSGLTAEARAVVTAWVLENQDMPLSEPFRNAVASLPTSSEPRAYSSFLARFGTHFAKRIIFGGRAWQSFVMTSDQYLSLRNQGTDVRLAAGVGFGSGVGAGTYTSEDLEQWQQLSSSSESLTTQWVGGSDLSTWKRWAATVPQNPLPVGIDLVDISELLRADRFPDDPGIETKRALMEQATLDYAREISDGLVKTRPAPTSRLDPGVSRFMELERRMFITGIPGSSRLSRAWTSVDPNETYLTSSFWLQRPDGLAGPVESGDEVYLGYVAPVGGAYLSLYDGPDPSVVRAALDQQDPSFLWVVLEAADPSATGQPLAQGTPLLLQNRSNGKVMHWTDDGSLKVNVSPEAASVSARLAFV